VLAARWDSEATASPRLHLQSSHSQSKLTSSSDTLGVAWQRQYRHGNSCTGVETAVPAWQRGCRRRDKNVRRIPLAPAVPLPFPERQGCPVSPRHLQLAAGAGHGLVSFSSRHLALHELSCQVSARVSQVLTSREPCLRGDVTRRSPVWENPPPHTLPLPEKTHGVRDINLGDPVSGRKGAGTPRQGGGGTLGLPSSPRFSRGLPARRRGARAAAASQFARDGDPVGASEVTQRCAKQTRQRARRGRVPAPGVNSLTWQTSPEAPSTPTCTRRQEPTRIRRQEPTRRRTLPLKEKPRQSLC